MILLPNDKNFFSFPLSLFPFLSFFFLPFFFPPFPSLLDEDGDRYTLIVPGNNRSIIFVGLLTCFLYTLLIQVCDFYSSYFDIKNSFHFSVLGIIEDRRRLSFNGRTPHPSPRVYVGSLEWLTSLSLVSCPSGLNHDS